VIPAKTATCPGAVYCPTCEEDTIVGPDTICLWCDTRLDGRPLPDHWISGRPYTELTRSPAS
jgi:hypothetical protein